MKAYIIKIELQESEPLIWRRVIMPANATYNRLHDVIQNVTNFKSGYPYDAYHLFEFNLEKENIIVTNNEEAYEEHKHYMNNKSEYEARIKEMPVDMQKFAKRQNEFLEKVVKKPKHYKISKYLEKYKTIEYVYDFGDNWRFSIILEDIVDDYYFGFPTVLDGAETAPPEDVGGIYAYYEFLKIYNDKSHPDHQRTREWGEGTHFRAFNPEHINKMLKGIQYQKTNWDLINHKNYKIIDDKYRKNN